jgi:hypothetical protein
MYQWPLLPTLACSRPARGSVLAGPMSLFFRRPDFRPNEKEEHDNPPWPEKHVKSPTGSPSDRSTEFGLGSCLPLSKKTKFECASTSDEVLRRIYLMPSCSSPSQPRIPLFGPRDSCLAPALPHRISAPVAAVLIWAPTIPPLTPFSSSGASSTNQHPVFIVWQTGYHWPSAFPDRHPYFSPA